MRWTLVADDETLAVDDEEQPAPPEVDDEDEDELPPPAEAGTYRFHALMVPEGVWSGDGRFINQDALTWRELPLPLMGLDTTTMAHEDATLVGHFDRIERQGSDIHGYGVWADTEQAKAIRQLVVDGHMRGFSVDMDDIEYEMLIPKGDEDDGLILMAAEGEDDREDIVVEMDEPRMRVTAGRLMGGTVVPFPAFQEAFIEDGDGPAPALVAAAVGGHSTGLVDEPWDAAEQAGKLPDPLPVATAEAMFAWLDPEMVDGDTVALEGGHLAHHMVADDGTPGDANLAALDAAVADLDSLPEEDRQAAYDHLAQHYTDNDAEPPPYEPAPPEEAVVAALRPIAAPVAPPRAWFDPPGFHEYTPFTVTDDGRVFGHIADWESCHISYPDRCVPPPRSASAYAHFHTGEVRCSDGTRVAVGHIAASGGHADLSYSAAQAQAFYDDTRSCCADVVAGEDRWGIWVAGALRPETSPTAVRTVMASGVSGDWRRIGGQLEMIHVSSVNVPGFLRPRARVRESAGLVASLIVDLPAAQVRHDRLLGQAVEIIAESIGRSTEQRIAALHASVHGGS